MTGTTCPVCGGPCCPECGAAWPDRSEPCSGCGRAAEGSATAYEALLRRHPHAPTTWPPGILSRVSREAYNAVGRSRGFQSMTPDEREAAAVSYDQLKRRRKS